MNKLFFGDNLDVLTRHVETGSVDLVYLDPPFNSKAQYNLLYETPADEKETAQRMVFRDTWTWGGEAQTCFEECLGAGGKVAAIVNALHSALGRSDTMAYLVMMAARLVQIRRVLKPTGSLYLHCDPAASHYLKVLLDAIFGPQSFLNEIIWKRTGAHGSARRWAPVHDVILFYDAGGRHIWNKSFQAYEAQYVEEKYRQRDGIGLFQDVSATGAGIRNGASGEPWRDLNPTKKGRHWAIPDAAGEGIEGFADMNPQEKLEALEKRGDLYWPRARGDGPNLPRIKQRPAQGNPIQDCVVDIPALNSQAKERLGYPTQKPLALLKRIIAASSRPGDVVLDPFCGCGTTVHAAHALDRKWVGIDVSYYAIRLIQRRLAANFGKAGEVEIAGVPADIAGAEALAERDAYAFQQWAVSELGCQLWNDGKRGADGGIDGEMWFFSGPGKPGRLLAQVKGGRRVGPDDVRAFSAVLAREKAQMGVFFCRNEPTAGMRTAATIGDYAIGSTKLPRLQIVSLRSWFAGRRPNLPVPLTFNIPTDRSGRGGGPPAPQQPQFTFVIEGGIAPQVAGQVVNPSMIPENALKLAG